MESVEIPPSVPLSDKPVGEALVSAYADARAASVGSSPFTALGLTETQINTSWKSGISAASEEEYILLGTFSDADAVRIVKQTQRLGRIVRDEGGQGVSLSLFAPKGADIDAILEQSWQLGARDAFVVRQ